MVNNIRGNEVEEPVKYVEREHSQSKCVFMVCGLAMCITVDILQYSMPLAFLPSVLEDRGHSPIHIATCIGIYYWTGFLGGFIITSYQIWRVLYEKQSLREVMKSNEVSEYMQVCNQIKYLIIGLGIGAITLFAQALRPTWQVHTACRFMQGFAGAFIFFYTFLTCVALFREGQQIFAMTMASCALNVAEVFGSFMGAVLFDTWGQRSVFWFLGVVSILNQVYLIAVLYMVNHQEVPVASKPSPLSRQNTPAQLRQRIALHTPPPTPPPGQVGPPSVLEPRECGCFPKTQPGACQRLKSMMESRPLVCSCLLITMSAVIKGSIEEMLPFHADHRWGYDPMQIGEMFCTIAIAYILSAGIVGHIWVGLGNYQIVFSAYWIMMVGIVAWLVFAAVSYFRDGAILSMTLAAYGVCLGMTHTPAALLLAACIDHEEGSAKDAVNGIWNTMWEAGGSLGFLLGGLLAERYHEQMALLTSYAICAVATSLCMVTIASWPEEGFGCIDDKVSDQGSKDSERGYGSTA